MKNKWKPGFYFSNFLLLIFYPFFLVLPQLHIIIPAVFIIITAFVGLQFRGLHPSTILFFQMQSGVLGQNLILWESMEMHGGKKKKKKKADKNSKSINLHIYKS